MPDYMKLTLQGDHYTMGQQHGRQVRGLRPRIAEAMAARFGQIERDGPERSGGAWKSVRDEDRISRSLFHRPLLDANRIQLDDLLARLQEGQRHTEGTAGGVVGIPLERIAMRDPRIGRIEEHCPHGEPHTRCSDRLVRKLSIQWPPFYCPVPAHRPAAD